MGLDWRECLAASGSLQWQEVKEGLILKRSHSFHPSLGGVVSSTCEGNAPTRKPHGGQRLVPWDPLAPLIPRIV